MAIGASLPPYIAEKHAPDPEARLAGTPSGDTSVASLSAHQERLLAGFGILQSGTLQRRLESIGRGREREREIKRQVVPASASHHPDSQVQKELAISPFLPTFIPPHPSSRFPTDFNMAFGGFDPSKYGAPPKKQKLPEVASPEPTPTSTHDQRSDSKIRSTASEASPRDVRVNNPVIEVSSGPKDPEYKVLQPKSTNRISIPGFDASRYGKSNLKKSQTLAQDGVSADADGEEGKLTPIQTSKPATHSHPTPLSQVQDSTSIYSQSQGTKISQKDNIAGTHSLLDKNETAVRGSTTQTGPLTSHARTPEMTSSNMPLPVPGMSKEERLKQVQHATMRQIGARNRSKRAVPETTSLRDLHLARTQTSTATACDLPLSAPTIADTEERSTTVASEATSPLVVKINDTGVAPRAPSSTLPPPLPGMSKAERLKQVQEARLREIGVRNRGDGRTPETTSLMDLNLARTPTRPEMPISATAHNFDAVKQNAQEIQSAANASQPTDILTQRSRNLRWCTNEELRPEPNLEAKSNAWGSNIPSNASTASDDSLRPMQLHSRLFNGPPAGESDGVQALVGWDGKMQPPPVDWNDRPRFNNNSPAFKNGFINWFTSTARELYEFVDRTPTFKQIPYHMVENVEWHADGIFMVRRGFALNAHNISKYGYDSDLADTAKYAEAVTAEEFEDWGKLDMNEPDNLKFKDETTEQLVNNWRVHWENSKKSINVTLAVLPGHKTTKENKTSQPEINPNKPLVNIYIRPAVKADIKQMRDLYNWWVENSVRTAETRVVELSDLQERLDNSRGDDRLPFVVAILKGKKDVPRDDYTGVKGEQVVGFALATGFTAPDYVEHIAAELEIYVHHKYLRQGIGRCLLDRLMCATDRGHMERGGYPFHCDPAERHWYEVGGARDLHKLMFVARHHSRPKKDVPDEVDVTTWMKKWLVKDWDFEQEACLKQSGAKNGRFLDTTYFSKFTKWLPEEGRVPDPEPKDYKHAIL